jgi:hypothetical protein
MPRKPVSPQALKAAKQKKIAIGGGIVFVLLLVFMVPKTMKLMHPHHDVGKVASSSSSSDTTGSTGETPSTPTTAAPADSTTPSTPASVPVSNTAATTVLTATLAPAAREGQLESLSSSFAAKDPFKQLVDPNAPPPTATTATAQPVDTSKPAAPASPPKPTTPGPELKVVPTVTPPTGGPAPVHVTPKAVLPFLSALITVNGAASQVNLRLDFPTAAPIFHLLSLTKKTAKVSVVGGSLAGGTPTLTLRRDKPVTLVNTADGTRYKLELMSTSTQAAVTKKPVQPAQTTTTQTPTTSTTPTTTTPSDTSTTTSGG